MTGNKYGLSENALHDELLLKLTQLAGEWKTYQDAAVMQRYQAVLLCLMELGWTGTLDAAATLPDTPIMWAEFQKLFAIPVDSDLLVPGAFCHNLIHDQLGEKLTQLAGAWRGTKSDDLVQRYHAVLIALRELGCTEALDLELLLPRRLIPTGYLS